MPTRARFTGLKLDESDRVRLKQMETGGARLSVRTWRRVRTLGSWLYADSDGRGAGQVPSGDGADRQALSDGRDRARVGRRPASQTAADARQHAAGGDGRGGLRPAGGG